MFEKHVSFPMQNWDYSNKPEFKFNISDTTGRYNIFLVIRHTDGYKYNNLWLKTDLKAPGDTIRTQNIDIPLSSDANGWSGKGMDDIYEFRKNITPGPIPFKKPGTYVFTLSQVMRENPLEHILNVGIRVEKVKLQ